MSTVALLASIALGAAFVVAGASKLAAGPAWPSQARGLGAPAWTIPIVPWLELALGALLVVRLVPVVAAGAAAALLVAFTVLIGVRLREGVRPPCACFGAWSAEPIGWKHVARNLALLVLAALAAF
jgi:uncharacterized membrane protein YphA (DoxX/SURF4 family)